MRALALAAALVALVLLVASARVVLSSRSELSDADARAAAGDRAGAVERWGRAARLYAPGNPYSGAAFAHLEEAAVLAEARGDRPFALAAWRELRSACLATRSFYTPHEAGMRRANERIAALAAALESPSVEPGADEPARARWHAARLAEDYAPRLGFVLLALAGFLAFLGCCVAFFFLALDDAERLRRRPALLLGAGALAAFAAFVLGLARA